MHEVKRIIQHPRKKVKNDVTFVICSTVIYHLRLPYSMGTQVINHCTTDRGTLSGDVPDFCQNARNKTTSWQFLCAGIFWVFALRIGLLFWFV